MRIQHTSGNNGQNHSGGFFKSKKSLGIIAGFIATAISLPFLASRVNVKDKESDITPDNSSPPKQLLISENDREVIERLQKKGSSKDLKLHETQWVEVTYPTIRSKLINLYKAEREDNELLRAGKITEKDRKVKIAFTDHVPLDGEGEDMGLGSHLHVVKYFDEKQSDGFTLRTYVNEHWPINEKTGGILPPESIRVRAQVFKGSLYIKGADRNLIPDTILVQWSKTNDSKENKTQIYPYLYRQHFYDNYDKEKGTNPVSDVEFFLSTPTSCISCHKPDARGIEKIFLKPGEKRTNFGAITPDEEFKKPYSEQRGYKIYQAYLEERGRSKRSSRELIDATLKDLQNSTNLEIPNIVQSFEKYTTIPWAGPDALVEKNETVPEGYSYEFGRSIWEKGGYKYYRKLGILEGLGRNWSREDLQLIPRPKN